MPETLNPIARKLKSFFGRSDATLKEALRALSPEELASIIESLTFRERRRVVSLISEERLAQVLTHVGPHASRDMLKRLSSEKILRLIGFLESDDVADIIQKLDIHQQERIIQVLKKSDPKKVLQLLLHEEDTAGGLMKTEILKAGREKTVEEVRRAIGSSRIADTTAVFVTDPDGRLVGRVSLIRLVTAKSGAKLEDIMQGDPFFVPSRLPQEDVVALFEEQDVLEAPVVDPRGKLLGVITADDILDVIEEEHTEDVSRLVGTSEDERISDPWFIAFRRRIPWLFVNLFTASFAAWVVTNFESMIARIAVLAALMPVVAGLGGNSASQSLGVTLRALALGEFHAWSALRVLWRQVVVGVVNGLLLGGIMSGVVWWWTKNATLSGVVIAAMMTNILLGSLLGVAVPLTLKRLKVDPAMASSVFLTATTDAAGFFVFLSLATLFL